MPVFNEAEWIKLLFLLSDTQAWMQQMEHNLFMHLPIEQKNKLFRKSYFITASSFAHILERHYYKISRHPGCGKFNIDAANIMHWIREAFHQPVMPMSGQGNMLRTIDAGDAIGTDKFGNSTSIISIISSSSGEVITAFPGQVEF